MNTMSARTAADKLDDHSAAQPLDVLVPMASWTAAQTAAWIVLAIPVDREEATKLCAEIETDELDGAEFEHCKVQRLHGMLRRAGVRSPHVAASKIVEARAALHQASPQVSRAQAPPSTQRVVNLTSSNEQERRVALQAALNGWRSGRWTIESNQELGRGGAGTVFRVSDARLGTCCYQVHAYRPASGSKARAGGGIDAAGSPRAHLSAL